MKNVILKQYHVIVGLSLPDGENVTTERIMPLISNLRLFLDSEDRLDREHAHFKQTLAMILEGLNSNLFVEAWED
jgi:D-Tyr-tRNAtyr deacylase